MALHEPWREERGDETNSVKGKTLRQREDREKGHIQAEGASQWGSPASSSRPVVPSGMVVQQEAQDL